MQLEHLETVFLGKKTYHYKEIDSTQSEIWRRINKQQIENGTLILAGIQTSGKGTRGRIWHTDEGNNIAFSCFIELNCDINKLNGITIKIAEIIVEIFKNKYNIELEIKEPNDIYYKGKKLGGILVETKISSNIAKYMVVGIGINTNKTIFSEDIKDIATSIKKEFGIDVDTKKFIIEFCNRFEKGMY